MLVAVFIILALTPFATAEEFSKRVTKLFTGKDDESGYLSAEANKKVIDAEIDLINFQENTTDTYVPPISLCKVFFQGYFKVSSGGRRISSYCVVDDGSYVGNSVFERLQKFVKPTIKDLVNDYCFDEKTQVNTAVAAIPHVKAHVAGQVGEKLYTRAGGSYFYFKSEGELHLMVTTAFFV